MAGQGGGYAIGVDLARFAFDVPGIGWVNFLFVWACVHQIGYWWSDRDDAGISARFGWLLTAGALSAHDEIVFGVAVVFLHIGPHDGS